MHRSAKVQNLGGPKTRQEAHLTRLTSFDNWAHGYGMGTVGESDLRQKRLARAGWGAETAQASGGIAASRHARERRN